MCVIRRQSKYGIRSRRGKHAIRREIKYDICRGGKVRHSYLGGKYAIPRKKVISYVRGGGKCVIFVVSSTIVKATYRTMCRRESTSGEVTYRIT